MRTQIQATGKRNYGSCESCKAVNEEANNDRATETDDKSVKIQVKSSSQLFKPQTTAKGDPRLSAVLSNSAIVQKSWPPLTNQSGKKSNSTGDDVDDDDNNSTDKNVGSQHKKTMLQRAADIIPCLGIILALFASVFLGSAGMLVKMTRSVHGIQVAVFR